MKDASMRHPKGLYFCFMTEMWERFSFYGISAILVLFLVAKFHFGARAALIFGNYVTYVYITTALGGVIADRWIGYRRCAVLGGSCIALGDFILALSFFNPMFVFLGLGFVSAGTGLFKSNVNVIMGKIYDERPKLRNSGFAYFYAGINIGSLIATFLVGWVGLTFGFSWGFLLCAIGMGFGMFIFLKGRKYYPAVVERHNPMIYTKKILGLTIWRALFVAIVIVALLFAYIIAHPVAADIVTIFSLVVLVGYLMSLWKKLKPKEKKNIFMILFLSIFMVLFWSFNNQMYSSFPVLIQHFVSRHLFGIGLLTTSVMGFYLIFLTIVNPFFGFMWQKLAEHDKEPGDDIKFVLSLISIGIGFLIITVGIRAAIPIDLSWVFLSYLFIGFGELLISPVGLSMVTRLAPEHLSATMMGLWWTISAYAGVIGGIIGAIAIHSHNIKNVHPGTFAHTYLWIFIWSIILAGILLACVPMVRKMGKGRGGEIA